MNFPSFFDGYASVPPMPKCRATRRESHTEQKEKDKLIHLLACLAEECGEVQRLVGRSIQSSVTDHSFNWEEVNEVIRVFDILCEAMGELESAAKVGVKL